MNSLLASAEIAINKVLSSDPELLAHLQKLDGYSVGISVTGLGLELIIKVKKDTVLIQQADENKKADVYVKGAPFDLLSLLTASNEKAGPAKFSTRNIEISGDVMVLQRFNAFVENMDFDWEEFISQQLGGGELGDMIAVQAGKFFKGAQSFLSKAGEALVTSSKDYIQEEAQLSPTKIEVENFSKQVNDFRMTVDRLDARLKQLNPESK